ncbi:MAG: peptide deformylase [Candidatus Dadabacteria bacterium]|nr:MAG: peptide deformylase [Candidatus Dadabacteria bacterium]
MATLEIVKYPDPRLKEVCSEVSEFNSDLEQFLRNMADTMYAAHGIGLAGPQVGFMYRVTVIDVSEERNDLLYLVNPEIVEASGSTNSEEGCLSIPGYRDTVKRHEEIVCKAMNPKGEEFTIEADGLLAICIQHEIDHLDGILFIDRMSRLKREMFRRWCKKHYNPNPQPPANG